MPSLHLSNSATDGKRLWLDLVTWIVREATGLLFVFSGFVKSVDVWGTFYKISEYLTVMGLPRFDNVTLALVFILCGIEFFTGIALMLGCYRKSSPIGAFAIMCFMLPLTLWIAISNPVADCGCFGDALVISNWATFWKNVALMVCVIWLLKFNTRIRCLITPAFQWIAVIASGIYITCIGWYGYYIQPAIDFRPFHVGSPLIEEQDDEDSDQFIFTYERDGISKDFTTDNIPDESEGWTFVSRRLMTSPNVENTEESGHDFRVLDKYGTSDVTEDAIDTGGKMILLLIPSLKDISPTTTYKINMLYDWAEHNDIDFVGIVAAHSGNLAEWEDLSMPRYQIYSADDTAIKEVARGNPSVVYLDNGIIKWKSSLAALNENMFVEPDSKLDIMSLAPNDRRFLSIISLGYAGVLLLLIAISFIPGWLLP